MNLKQIYFDYFMGKLEVSESVSDKLNENWKLMLDILIPLEKQDLLFSIDDTIGQIKSDIGLNAFLYGVKMSKEIKKFSKRILK